MKRTPLARRTPLERKTWLRARPKPRIRSAGEQAWKTPRWGRCQNCGLVDDEPLHGHHILARQYIARAGGNEWDPRNRLDLCGTCHFNHEFGMLNRKISRDRIPECAVEFAVGLLGEDLAMVYLMRHYREVEA